MNSSSRESHTMTKSLVGALLPRTFDATQDKYTYMKMYVYMYVFGVNRVRANKYFFVLFA